MDATLKVSLTDYLSIKRMYAVLKKPSNGFKDVDCYGYLNVGKPHHKNNQSNHLRYKIL